MAYRGWSPYPSTKPTKNGYYLITIGYIGANNVYYVVERARWNLGTWKVVNPNHVIAWRALPAPYQPPKYIRRKDG